MKNTEALTRLGLRNRVGNVGCKIVVYLERVAQAVTVTPEPRGCGARPPLASLLLDTQFLDEHLPFYIENISNMNTSQIIRSDNYCYFQPDNWMVDWILFALMVLLDAVFQGVLGGASGHRVVLLHKHHQQVLHLQTSKLLYRTPPEEGPDILLPVRWLLHTTSSAGQVQNIILVNCIRGLGVVGNTFVLVNYMGLFRSTMKCIHLILIHLAFTNIITLLTGGMPRTISTFGLRDLIDDITCKIVVYFSRVARGLSICTTSLLTVVQAITISPRASKWRRLQPRSAWHILSLLLFFWILNSLISMNLPFYIKNTSSVNTSQFTSGYNYCYLQPQTWIIRWIFIVLMVLRDAVFQGVMAGASGYMVFLLHKHHQQVLHLQTSKLLYRSPPEVKAAKSVLLLMLCFLFFYWADCFMTLYVTFTLETHFLEVSALELVDLGYAILSPFVLIHRDGHLGECCRAQ
ncbi:vomeronasal type-1 receptor 4-like [Urocitellus parryii]